MLAVLVLGEAPLLPDVARWVHLDSPLVGARAHPTDKVPVDGVVANADGRRVFGSGRIGGEDGVAGKSVATGEKTQFFVGHCVKGAVLAEIRSLWDANIDKEGRALDIENPLGIGVLKSRDPVIDVEDIKNCTNHTV